jgi:hypothetical protein
MAKVSLGGPLIGALFNSVTPPSEDKKRAVKPRKNKTTKGEMSATEPGQQHGELANSQQPKMPSDAAMIREEARRQKRRTTEDWIAGRVSTKQHEHVHRRANHVLSSKKPREFRGKTGEKAMKGMW